jgi:hypothetical protein
MKTKGIYARTKHSKPHSYEFDTTDIFSTKLIRHDRYRSNSDFKKYCK